jgi:hypothetical protein
MESSAVKSLKLPTFDGKKDKFQTWWTKFTAHASVFGFREALIIGGESDMPVRDTAALDPASEADKPKIAAKKRTCQSSVFVSMTRVRMNS